MVKSRLLMLLLLPLLSGGNVSGADGLPDIAVALSSSHYQAEIERLSKIESPYLRIILPTIEFRLAEKLDLDESLDALPLIGSLIPVPNRVWLRLKVFPPPPGLEGPEIEAEIGRLVTNLIQRLDFIYAGIILEFDSMAALDYVALVVSSLSVSVKITGPGRFLAVPCEIAAALGSKIAVHVDRYVLSGKDSWRPTMQKLADLKILRPIIFFWTVENGRTDPEAYMDTLLATLKYDPELFVIPTGRLEDLEKLLETVRGLEAHLPSEMTPLVDEAPLFYLSNRKGDRPPQAVFVDDLLDRVVILAKTEDRKTAPSQWRLIAETGDSYSVIGYDPLVVPSPRGKEFWSENIIWDSRYLLLQAGRTQSEKMRFGDTAYVSARIDLTVAEVIARWQQYHSRQIQLLRHYVASAEMDLHFQPPGLGSGFDVSLHFRYFWDHNGERYWEQIAQYLNGIKIRRNQVFPLPQLEPDKIVIQPLELKLIENYVYFLEGVETVGGSECYKISFTPRPESTETLFSGAIWIDRTSFRRVKMLLVQANSSGSITSNREVQFFELVRGPEAEDLNILVRSDVEQKVLVAGREFLLERKYRFDNISLNSSDYQAILREAFHGDKPMFTETALGLREFAKDKEDVRRIVEKVDTFVWSLIVGTLYDGTFRFPLPLLGASVIDSNFLKSNGQLSGFWAGPILAINYTQKSKNNFWAYGLDVFFSALPRHDRVFRGGEEAKGESLYLFSESLGVRLRWQPAVSLAINASVYSTYEIYAAAKATSDDFVLPRNGFTLNSNVSFELVRSGYLATFELGHYERLRWRKWGLPENEEHLEKSFQRVSVKLGKQFYLNSFTRLGLDLAYHTGSDFDRFSSYQPSVMSTPKIRGIPSGTISLNRIGTAGLNLGFTVFDFIRMDAFYNYAKCVEQSAERRTFDLHGLELDFGTIGPWQSYIQGVVSYAVKGLPRTYGSSWSVYLLFFLPF